MSTQLTPRTAYILTKLVVFAVAAVLTWPLAKIIGPKAWWGLGVFGLILVVFTGVVFVAFGRHPSPGAAEEPDDGGEEPDPDRPFELPLEDFIDLHPFPPRDIPDVVVDYLEAAHNAGFREVRLIHGRGVGVQRERVRNALSKHPLVEAYSDAPADRGGWGATIARLSQGES
ncbi:MAG: Smr/MutS family protein [Thermoanaerobaculales bacterium]|nr:Smr/MutS family protein [Thermoanaerobaculales bacterium]